jgi:excisionase family DNA binding protein
MNTQPEDAVTTREAAKLLSISLRTAQLWVEAGILKAWKTVGGHRRILRTSVDELLAQRQGQIAPSQHSVTAAPEAREPASGDFMMLVVEDDPALLRLYELTIAGWKPPVKLTLAQSGWEALIAIGHERPDVLVTDLRLPGMDGFRMMRVLTSAPELGRDMHIIVVTGLDKGEIEAFGGLPESITVLHKPLSFPALEKLIIEKRLTSSGKLNNDG